MVFKGRVLSGFSSFYRSHLLMRPQPFAVCCCLLVRIFVARYLNKLGSGSGGENQKNNKKHLRGVHEPSPCPHTHSFVRKANGIIKSDVFFLFSSPFMRPSPCPHTPLVVLVGKIRGTFTSDDIDLKVELRRRAPCAFFAMIF